MKRPVLALPLVFVALGMLVVAGSTPRLLAPESVQAEEERFTLSLEEGIDISDLLNAVSHALDTPLVWDSGDKQIRGKTLEGSLTIDVPRSEAWATIRALLSFYDLVAIPVGPKEHAVTLVMDARRTNAILRLKATPITLTDRNVGHYVGLDGFYVTTVFELEHETNLRSVRNALTRVVTGQNIGNVTEIPERNALVVTDFAPNVAAIYRLLQRIDKPARKAPGRVLETVALKHASASKAATILQRLYPAGPRQGAQQTPSYAGPQVQPDPRTNQLLIAGMPDEVEQILAAVRSLDRASPAPETQAQLVRLEHMDAMEAMQSIHSLIGNSRTLWRDESDPGARPGVVAVQRINGLLISATAEDFERIRQLLAELDAAAAD